MTQTKFKNKPLLKVIPLGGVGDVTKNMYIYETGRDIVIIDCGLGFPDETMYGVDVIIPDISYLEDRKRKIRSIIITHGHDDHIGALQYLLPELNAPVYSLPLTIGLITEKLKERGINPNRYLRAVKPTDCLFFGDFKVEFFRVSHSIPDSIGVVLTTPAGTIVHTGDFKFDWTPEDFRNIIDVGKIASVGNRGVLALFSDCVRVENPGYTLSEREIGKTFDDEIENWTGRIFITTFSSNISRIAQAINSAEKHGRYVCLVGRSMEQTAKVASEFGYLKIPANLLISQKEIKKIPDKNLLFLISGSQGQAGSALSRVANKDHEIKIKSNDLIIFASDPVPGNEDAVHSLIDSLTKQGAEVRYTEITDSIHVSGHASAEELMLMLSLIRPKYLIPISATFRHLKYFATLAEKQGFQRKNILLGENGTIFEFGSDFARLNGKVEVKNILVDGLGIGDVGTIVLRDRKQMAADGIVVVIVPISETTGQLVGEVDIVSRGFVYVKESEELIKNTKRVVKETLRRQHGWVADWQFLKKRIEENLEKFLYKETQRRPMVLPVVIRI